MKKIIGFCLVGAIGIFLVGCSGSKEPVAESENKNTEISSIEKEQIDTSNISIPEEVKKISTDFPDEFSSADSLTVETGSYRENDKDVEKPIVELINDDSGDSLIAILSSESSVEKYIFRGNQVSKMYKFVDSIEQSPGISTTLTDEMNSVLDNGNILEKEYSSDTRIYSLLFDMNREDPLKTTTLNVTNK